MVNRRADCDPPPRPNLGQRRQEDAPEHRDLQQAARRDRQDAGITDNELTVISD